MKSRLLKISFALIFKFAVYGVYGQVNVSFTSSNLPIIVINTNGGVIKDDPKITSDMGIIYNGVGATNNVTDPFNNFSGKIGIEIRGSTSQDLFPKKQYGIEIQDSNGEGIDVSLLGLPKKDDWVLFAPYNDKSLMRDVLAYKLGRDLGRYASRFRYVELVINNKYQGIYVLFEKVKRDKNRVDIAKLDPDEISGENLTGGYIVKLDKMTGSGGDGWASTFPPLQRTGNQTTFFQYDYPKPEDIAPQQKQYIKDYFNAFETALKGPNFQSPTEGYQKYIDVNSFVDYFISNEMTRNPDAYRLSTFMHKKKDSDGGKLYMGPIWDFNIAMGNVDFCIKGKPEGWVIDYNSICPQDGWLIPFWWNRLFMDESFRGKVTARWTTLRQGVYQTSRIMNFIDSVATVLKTGDPNNSPRSRNFQAWPVIGQYLWPNAFVGTSHQAEVDYLKDWMTKRLTWMDQNIGAIITGVEENSTAAGLQATVYPNPYKEQIQLEYEIDNPGHVTIEMFDVTGKKLQTIEKEHPEQGKYGVSISQEVAGPGMYFVKVKFGLSVRILKVIRL